MALFTARQPIFDRGLKVIAYELLYRTAKKQGSIDVVDGTKATTNVLIQSMMTGSYMKMSSNKKVFINFTKDLLLSEVAYLLDKEKVVIELLEDIDYNDEILECVLKLKKNGYMVALDDMTLRDNQDGLLPYVDVVKVDFMQLDTIGRLLVTKKLRQYDIKLLAEKVETKDDYNEAMKYGYHYFQGYFFSKPEVMESKDIEVMSSTRLRLMNELNKPDPDNDVLAKITAEDVSLTFKLLKLINSASFYRIRQVTSIKEAIVTMGLKDFKKWLLLLMLQDVNKDKPSEIIQISLVRARFMENFAFSLRDKSISPEMAFMTGMLSMIDALADRKKEDVLTELPINDDIKCAIMNNEGNLGYMLKLIQSVEVLDEPTIVDICKKYNTSEDLLSEYYMEAIKWSEELLVF